MNKNLVYSVFDRAAVAFPDRIAIEEAGQICYDQLRKYSNRIGHCLTAAQVTRGSTVGVYVNSGIDYVAAVLGIGKAGGVFMPLDATHPHNRLRLILREVNPSIIVTNREHREGLRQLLNDAAEPVRVPVVIVLDGAEAWIRTEENENGVCVQSSQHSFSDESLPLVAAGEDSNYLLYTSGSTGRPKAIEGCHRSLSHFIHWEIKEFGLDEHTKVSQFAPLSFDVSLRDIFVPLTTGGTLCIPPRQVNGYAREILRWIGEKGITLIHIVPSLFRLLTQALEEEEELVTCVSQVQYILLAGEPLYGKDVLAWREAAGTGAELVNLYGPSETTLAKIFNRINGKTLEADRMIPLGKPIANAAVVILKNNKLCQIGEIGEIYIKTPFRSKGYYKDPELTSKLFIQSPLHNEFEDIVYKTGDLGRYSKDGEVEYVGRQDTLVKIRGNRVELFEVEKAVLAYPGIRQAVVVPLPTDGGETVLACYYRAAEAVEEPGLRKHLAEELPAYMHPAFYVPVEEFPLSLNGKIDKRALPRPEALLYQKLQYEAPRNLTEEKLADIWTEVLGLKKVGINNSFFELGGHSLNATRVVSRIFKAFKKDVTLKDLFDNPTVARLACLLEQKLQFEYKSIEPVAPQPYYDVSHAQKRLWILDQFQEQGVAYNVLDAYVFTGALDVNCLHQVLETLVSRHESLRTNFIVVDGEPKQVVHPAAEAGFRLERDDLRGRPDAALEARRLVAQEAGTPFNLAADSLLRAKLVRLPEDKYLLVIVMHHIISDAWSTAVLTKEILALYDGYAKKAPNPLPPLRIQYKDYAAWQNRLLREEAAEGHREYWLNEFKGELPVLELPTDLPRPVVKTFNGSRTGMVLDETVSSGLLALGQGAGATLFMTLLGSVKTLLYKYTGQTDLTVGSPIAGRNHRDLEEQIGFYVNTLALRTRLEEDESFGELLGRIRSNTLKAYEHQMYPFDCLVNELKLDRRDMSRAPLFDVMVVLHNVSIENQGAEEIEGVAISSFPSDHLVSKFDITFSFRRTPTRILVSAEYNTDLFRRDTIDRMLSRYNTLLASILRDSRTPLRDLEYVAPEEQQLLAGCNRVAAGFPRNATIQQLFEARAAEAPERPAVSFAARTLSYRALNDQANQLAHYLRQQYHVQPGSIVGILMERSEWMMVAVLAVLKAGGAYVPLDPAYPDHRIAHLLKDTEARVVLTDAVDLPEGQAPGEPPYLPFVREWAAISGASPRYNPEPLNAAGDLAYLIYTSGSTGNPKGVMVEHRNVLQLLCNDQLPFTFTPNDVWTLFHSVCFDFSVWEMWGALLHGGELVVVPREVTRSPADFVDLLVSRKVTVLNQTPTAFTQVVAETLRRGTDGLALRYVVFGGEALNPSGLREWHAQYPHTKLINMYGITETTVHVTYKEIGREEIIAGASNIGLPLPTLQVYLVDKQRRLVPPGVVGEILVGGAGVTRGYLHNEALTNDRFIPSPYNPAEKLYCSGDLGLRLDTGEIVYKGRIDQQVKIRGYRIEPAEIENCLLRYPSVEDVAVICREDEPGAGYLAAYLVSKAEPDLDHLRQYVSRHLPDYMMPAYFVSLAALPLTANGKVNRKVLPDPRTTALRSPATGADAATPLEATILQAFRSVLGRENIQVNDNFFASGGDSIKAIQIAAYLHKEGYKVMVRDIFKNPTAKELVPVVATVSSTTDQAPVTGEVPLSPIQQDFFATPHRFPHHYNQAVMFYAPEGFGYEAVRAVFGQLQLHHDILRSTVAQNDRGDTVLRCHGPDFPVSVSLHDLRNRPNAGELLKEGVNQIQAGINLAEGPLMKVGLFRLSDGDRLLVVAHHLVIDGVSWRILFQDIGTLLGQYREGAPLALPLKTSSYKAWVEGLCRYANTPAFLEEAGHWTGIGRIPVPRIPHDFAGGDNSLKDSRSLSFHLGEAETELLLTQVHEAFGTEINDLLLTALGIAIREVFGNDKVLVAMEGHGREDVVSGVDITRTVGWFTSIYPVLLDSAYAHDLARQVLEVKDSLRRIPNRGVGFGILKYLTGAGHEQHLDIRSQVIFNYLGQFDSDVRNADLLMAAESSGPVKNAQENRPYELDMMGLVTEGHFRIAIEYSTRQYHTQTIQALGEAFLAALGRVIACCASVEEKQLSPSDFGYKDLSISDLETLFD